MARFGYSTPNTEGAGQLVDDNDKPVTGEEVIPLGGIALLEQQELEATEAAQKQELADAEAKLAEEEAKKKLEEVGQGDDELDADGKPVVAAAPAGDDDKDKVPAKTPQEVNAEIVAKAQADFLKSLGFDSVDDIKKVVADSKNVTETEEQKLSRIEKYNKDLAAYAISQSLLTAQDLTQIEALQKADDRSIAFNDFATEYRADNKDRLDEDGKADPVTEDELKEAFDELYHTGSSNQTLKNKGEKLMKEIADGIRSITNKKFENAKEKFDIEQDKSIQIPAYKTFVQSTISESIPSKIKVAGEGDNEIYFSTTGEDGKPLYDVAKLESLFKNNETYNVFRTGDKTELKASMVETIEEFILKENRAAINKLLLTQGESIGLKKGSVVGANAPFETKKPAAVSVDNKGLSSEAQKIMANRYAKIRS